MSDAEVKLEGDGLSGTASASRGVMSQSWFILAVALVGVVLFFMVRLGMQRAAEVRELNAERIAAYEAATTRGETIEKPLLDSPWAEGWERGWAFISADNLETIAAQTAIVGIAALGMTMVIVLGGIDLSVGSVIAFASVMSAFVIRDGMADGLGVGAGIDNVQTWGGIGLVAGVLSGAACGLVIGVLITRLKMMPFIVTLGMLGAVRGLAKGVADQTMVEAPDTWLLGMLSTGGANAFVTWPPILRVMVTASWWAAGACLATWIMWSLARAWRGDGLRQAMGSTTGRALLVVAWVVAVAIAGYLWINARYWSAGVWVMLWAAFAVAGLMRHTVFGRHVYAIGSNEQTARLCGVGVERVKVMVYTLMGGFAGLAGVMQFARLGKGDPTAAMGLELDVIAAVVIGGGSLTGGEGSVFGSIIGALILTVISVGCNQLGIDVWVQQILTGAIIVVAAAVDRLRHR